MNVDALLELAAEHQDAGRLDQAEAIYNQILSMTRDVDALHLLGALWQKRGRHDLAIPLLEEAVAIEATYADCWITLFGSLSASGQTEVAVNALRRAAELEPRSRVWNQLGCLLRDSGRLDESIQAFERAVQCDTGETPVSQSVAHTIWARRSVCKAIGIAPPRRFQ